MSRFKKTPVSTASGRANAFNDVVAYALLVRDLAEVLHIANKDYFTADGGFRLGEWQADQRTLYHAGMLEDWMIEELESVPGWTWDQANVERRLAH